MAFEHLPPFALDCGPVAIHPEHGIMLLAVREALDGAPRGLWVDLDFGGHYEIEAAATEV